MLLPHFLQLLPTRRPAPKAGNIIIRLLAKARRGNKRKSARANTGTFRLSLFQLFQSGSALHGKAEPLYPLVLRDQASLLVIRQLFGRMRRSPVTSTRAFSLISPLDAPTIRVKKPGSTTRTPS